MVALKDKERDAVKLHGIASMSLDACKEDIFALFEKLDAEIVGRLLKQELPIAGKLGLSSEFVLVREAVLSWMIPMVYEAWLKNDFRVIKEHRGYPK